MMWNDCHESMFGYVVLSENTEVWLVICMRREVIELGTFSGI